jgi:hypothetical protein
MASDPAIPDPVPAAEWLAVWWIEDGAARRLTE